MNNKDIDLDLLWKHARRPKFENGAFQVDPNNCNDVTSWYEYKSEHYDLILYYGFEYIEKLAKEKGLDLIETIEYLWKEKYEYEK